MRRGPSAMRTFDPRRVAALECDSWVAYYRRDWPRFLWAAIRLTRHAFGLPWPATLRSAWLVLRANQRWAPYPDNDPAGAREFMRRFYFILAAQHRERLDPEVAAGLEVEWWRIHRLHQREDGASEDALVDALAALYSHVYGVPAEDVRTAAAERARAMDTSDLWVRQGCRPGSPLIAEERAALVRSYAALLAAVDR
jgi:hypothetical protein